MLIVTNIAALEKTHTCGCDTAQKMWQNLKVSYQSSNYLVNSDKLRALCGYRAAEGDNIPEHLTRIKDKWDELTFYRKQYNIMLSDKFFKALIAGLLPQSWDDFTRSYVDGFLDDENEDAKHKIDSQEFISIIIQCYEYNESRKRSEIAPKQQNDKPPSLASRITDNDSNKRNQDPNKRPPHCRHCGHDGHKTIKCRFIGQSKCQSCNRFHDAQRPCWQTGSKHPNTETSNSSSKKQKRQANNVEENASQSNVAVEGKFFSLNADADVHTDTYASSNDNDCFYDWVADTGTTAHITNR
jgi:hypothetical protein